MRRDPSFQTPPSLLLGFTCPHLMKITVHIEVAHKDKARDGPFALWLLSLLRMLGLASL